MKWYVFVKEEQDWIPPATNNKTTKPVPELKADKKLVNFKMLENRVAAVNFGISLFHFQKVSSYLHKYLFIFLPHSFFAKIGFGGQMGTLFTLHHGAKIKSLSNCSASKKCLLQKWAELSWTLIESPKKCCKIGIIYPVILLLTILEGGVLVRRIAPFLVN